MTSIPKSPPVLEKTTDWAQGLDRTVAILGSTIPVAMVLGVVIFEFFVGLTGLVWLISRLKFPLGTYTHVTRNPLFWPIVAWFGVVLFSRIINWGTAYQFAHDAVFIRYPLYLAAMIDVSDRLPVRRYLIKGLIIGIIYAGLNLASAYLIGYDFIGNPLSRYVGKLKEGARIAGLCAYATPMLLLWAVFDGNLDRRKRMGVVMLGITAILLLINSKIRTALLSALIGLIGGYVWQLMIQKRLRVGSVLLLLTCAGLGVWAVAAIHPSLESIYDRVYFWEVSWQVWLQNPVAGVGISSFNDVYRQIAESGIVAPFVSPATGTVYQSVNPRHAHNLFLQLLACNGILGLCAFGWVFVRGIKVVQRFTVSWQAGLLSWPLVCLAVGLTGWNIYDSFYATIIFYFLAMISVSDNADREMVST